MLLLEIFSRSSSCVSPVLDKWSDNCQDDRFYLFHISLVSPTCEKAVTANPRTSLEGAFRRICPCHAASSSSVHFPESPQTTIARWTPCSGVAKTRASKPKIHVLLDMAVEEREARLIGEQIHCGASECGNDHRIFLDPGRGFTVDFDEFETGAGACAGDRGIVARYREIPIGSDARGGT